MWCLDNPGYDESAGCQLFRSAAPPAFDLATLVELAEAFSITGLPLGDDELHWLAHAFGLNVNFAAEATARAT